VAREVAYDRDMTSVEDRIASTDADRYVASAYANDRAHVFHSWSAQGALDPAVIIRPITEAMRRALRPSPSVDAARVISVAMSFNTGP